MATMSYPSSEIDYLQTVEHQARTQYRVAKAVGVPFLLAAGAHVLNRLGIIGESGGDYGYGGGLKLLADIASLYVLPIVPAIMLLNRSNWKESKKNLEEELLESDLEESS